MTKPSQLFAKGLLFGLIAGLIFGLLEVFFSLALIEDATEWGTDRSFVTHEGLAASILLFDTAAGALWGFLGACFLALLSRREGPLVQTDAFLGFWMALAIAVLYPTWFLFAKFLGPESRFAPYWLPIFIVWLGIAGAIGAALFYFLAVRNRKAGSFSLNIIMAALLSALVLGGAYWNSGAGSITDPGSILINLLILAVGFAVVALVLRLARKPGPRRGLAAIVAVALGLGTFQQAVAIQVRPGQAGTQAHASPSPHETGRLPNVVLIVLDTQRQDRLGIYNPELDVSPNLDKLAQDSVVYDNCIATSSWTLPSHASLFTGLYPTVHAAHYRLDEGVSPLNPDRARQVQKAYPLKGRATLAEVLRDGGYRTGAVCGNCGYLHPHFGLHAGFDFYDSRMPQPFRNPPVADLALFPMRHMLPFDYIEAGYHVEPQRKTYRSARSVAEVSREWLAADTEQPFFLFMNFCDPHAPYIPPFEHDLYSDDSTDLESPRAVDVAYNRQPVSDEMREHLISLYDGEVHYMDKQIGNVLEDLHNRGVYNDTLIIVTSDHGEYFGEHGRLGHGGHLHEVVVKIPLLVKYPESRQTGRLDHRVSLVDLMPTVLEETGLEPPPDMEGQSLRHGSRPVIAELYPSADRVKTYGEEARRTLRALYVDHWKLVQETGTGESPEYLLYNVTEDPGETTDLYEAEPAVAQELRQQLEDWVEGAEEKRFDDTELPTLDDETQETMRGLGYVQAGQWNTLRQLVLAGWTVGIAGSTDPMISKVVRE